MAKLQGLCWNDSRLHVVRYNNSTCTTGSLLVGTAVVCSTVHIQQDMSLHGRDCSINTSMGLHRALHNLLALWFSRSTETCTAVEHALL